VFAYDELEADDRHEDKGEYVDYHKYNIQSKVRFYLRNHFLCNIKNSFSSLQLAHLMIYLIIQYNLRKLTKSNIGYEMSKTCLKILEHS